MTDTLRKQLQRECQSSDEPADQPKPPGDGSDCEDRPQATPPNLDPPKPCPDPPACCKCPQKPGATSNCLEILIAKQSADIVAADKAKAFKGDLEKLLDSAKKASQAYTRDKYNDLLKKWLAQDAAIAELIRKLVCAVPCWRCILDCYVCPLLNELHYAEKWLYD